MTIKSKVPCNGCTLCCKDDAVRLYDYERDRFVHEVHPYMKGFWMLAHKKNGDCYYLGENGCTIHDSKPVLCDSMDCRNIANNVTYTNARKLDKNGRLRMSVWKKGKELLKVSKPF